MAAKSYASNSDPKLADATVEFSEFAGMAPNQDQHQGDPRLSALQINCYSIHPGELRCRQGIRLVLFSS